jgi:hypothetical protein
MPRNLFSSNPIPAKAKKLGLLSIYKFFLLPAHSQLAGRWGQKNLNSVRRRNNILYWAN